MGYGSLVTLVDTAKGGEVVYRLVTAEESDASQGLISTTSPIGRALMGKQVGETIAVRTPAGGRTFELVRLQTVFDD